MMPIQQNIDLHDLDASRQLCFDPNSFIDKSFSIDKFLRDHRNKATLEVLRDDLGSYLKTLRLSMIDLINKDYEDFVNLSKDLVGLNNGIEILENPLHRVKSEVMIVKTSLEDTIAGLVDCLKQDLAVKEKKQCLNHLAQVITSLNKLRNMLEKNPPNREIAIDVMERTAAEHTFLSYSMVKCLHLLSSEQKWDIEAISKSLLNLVSNMFLECICEKEINQLARCMRIFVGMDRVDDMERLLREELVVPFLSEVIRNCSNSNEPTALRDLYRIVIEFTDSQLAPLVVLGSEHSGKINFIARSLWPELERRLELDLPSIFSPGDPDAFRDQYAASVNFLSELEKRCGSHSAGMFLLSHPQTIRFRQKWNILVYFKIRFQEIAAELECAMALPADKVNDGDVYSLHVPAVTFLCVERCWDDSVYLPDAANLFWKLSLQLISRFSVWLKEEMTKAEKISTEQINSHLKLLVTAYVDSATLARETLLFLSSRHLASHFKAALDESAAQIIEGQNLISSCVVATLVEGSLGSLIQVKDIPRLFRRTNREMPEKSSEYVKAMLQLPTNFYEVHRNRLPSSVLHSWITSVFCQITKQFYVSVNEVLTNAQKTEESLRRLKKAKDRSAVAADHPGGSDDDKIRQQLLMDVERLCEGAASLQLSKDDVTNMPELLELVTSARKSHGLQK